MTGGKEGAGLGFQKDRRKKRMSLMEIHTERLQTFVLVFLLNAEHIWNSRLPIWAFNQINYLRKFFLWDH